MRDALHRIDELLLARATSGLTASESSELARLLETHPGTDTDVYELGAAAVWLAHIELGEPLPRSLRVKVEERAADFFARTTGERR